MTFCKSVWQSFPFHILLLSASSRRLQIKWAECFRWWAWCDVLWCLLFIRVRLTWARVRRAYLRIVRCNRLIFPKVARRISSCAWALQYRVALLPCGAMSECPCQLTICNALQLCVWLEIEEVNLGLNNFSWFIYLLGNDQVLNYMY